MSVGREQDLDGMPGLSRCDPRETTIRKMWNQCALLYHRRLFDHLPIETRR